MDLIRLENVSKAFGNKKVIDNISYNFEAGKIYGIVGTNGCGKSVLFKLISGLMKASSGKIIVNNVVVGKNGAMPADLGLLIEHPGFLPNLTGFENLDQLAAIKNKITKTDIEEILKEVALYQDKDIKVKKYSLGMLQRLGIAQALMEKPKLLLLDEPFNSMDHEGVVELREIIKSYIRNSGATMLITSHNKEDIDILSDQVLVLKNGKLKELKDWEKNSIFFAKTL